MHVHQLRGVPWFSIAWLVLLIISCLLAGIIAPYAPDQLDLSAVYAPPGGEHPLGTDSMGRDILSTLLFGGRTSLAVGLLSTAISVAIAAIYGCISALAPRWLDEGMMRVAEMAMSIPSILIVILLQAVLGEANVLSVSVVIGATGWMHMAKMVRSDVLQARNSGYVQAARCMGAGFWHLFSWHLFPGCIASIVFMAVSGIGTAIATEATLSFMGIGLPVTCPSWGSMLSGAERALLGAQWWIILIPGIFLVLTLIGFAQVGNFIRKRNTKGECNL
nr:ABC transporter permease [bacterium]